MVEAEPKPKQETKEPHIIRSKGLEKDVERLSSAFYKKEEIHKLMRTYISKIGDELKAPLETVAVMNSFFDDFITFLTTVGLQINNGRAGLDTKELAIFIKSRQNARQGKNIILTDGE